MMMRAPEQNAAAENVPQDPNEEIPSQHEGPEIRYVPAFFSHVPVFCRDRQWRFAYRHRPNRTYQ
eukprot:11666149-Alexandrium_andersonii.AAC.1